MKFSTKLFSILICACTANVTWGSDFSQKIGAFEFHGSYTADNLVNMSGGIKTGYAYLGFATLDVNFDFENAGLWRGASAYLMGASTHGAEPTSTMIGDFQAVSNIEAGDLIYIQEFWFRQNIGAFSAIVGVQDMNVEFLASEYGGYFINSSFGIISTIADNIPSPIFPLTGLGLTLGYQFNESFSLKTAIYDGNLLDFDENPYNTHWNFKFDEGFLAIGEACFQKNRDSGLHGQLKIGAYTHNHCPLNGSDSLFCKNTGVYAIIDHSVYSNQSTGRELALFAQAGFSPKKYNNNNGYIGFGSTLKAPFAKRTEDVLGLAVATSLFNDHVYSFESSVELTYSAALSTSITLQPDIQYVIHPSGTDEKLPNALVGILRLAISF